MYKKIGRPTDSVKNHEVKARIDEEMFSKLKEHAQKRGLNHAETIRNALNTYLNLAK